MGFPEGTYWERANVSQVGRGSSGCASVGGQTKLTPSLASLTLLSKRCHTKPVVVQAWAHISSHQLSTSNVKKKKCVRSLPDFSIDRFPLRYGSLRQWMHPSRFIPPGSWQHGQTADSITADVHNVPYRLLICHDVDHEPLPTSTTIQHLTLSTASIRFKFGPVNLHVDVIPQLLCFRMLEPSFPPPFADSETRNRQATEWLPLGPAGLFALLPCLIILPNDANPPNVLIPPISTSAIAFPPL